MKSVDQLIIDDGRGDCLRACVCSIIERDPAGVPNFADHGFFEGANAYLEAFGMKLMYVSFEDRPPALSDIWFGYPGIMGAADHVLVWGESPRLRADGGKKQHIIVAKPNGYGVEMIHDPHPDRTGIVTAKGFGWIIPAGKAA